MFPYYYTVLLSDFHSIRGNLIYSIKRQYLLTCKVSRDTTQLTHFGQIFPFWCDRPHYRANLRMGELTVTERRVRG